MVKQDFNKLLIEGFIAMVEEATWLLPIVVIPKKIGKLHICVNFKRLNVTMKKIHIFCRLRKRSWIW